MTAAAGGPGWNTPARVGVDAAGAVHRPGAGAGVREAGAHSHRPRVRGFGTLAAPLLVEGVTLTARLRAWAWIVFTGVVLLDAVALLLPGDLAVAVPAATTAVVWVALLSCFVLAQRRPVARSVWPGRSR